MTHAPFTVGIIQDSASDDRAATVDASVDRIREAAKRGAQIVCLKELFDAPYFCKSQKCERFDLAESIPGPTTDRMQALEARFWSDAEKFQVLPLFGGVGMVWGIRPPGENAPRTVTLYPGVENVAPGMIPPTYNRSFSITADLDVERNWCVGPACYGADGVIVANASFLGGYSLYVQGGRLAFTYSFLGLKIDNLEASEKLPAGKVTVRYEFVADEPHKMATGGTHRLFVGEKQVAEGKLEHTVPLRFSGYAGLDVGRDNGLPVSPNKVYYLRAPFPFESTIEKVTFDLK